MGPYSAVSATGKRTLSNIVDTKCKRGNDVIGYAPEGREGEEFASPRRRVRLTTPGFRFTMQLDVPRRD